MDGRRTRGGNTDRGGFCYHGPIFLRKDA
jgi:hypothetical protein